MVLDETNTPVMTEVFASGALTPADIQFGPDGALYYVSFSEDPYSGAGAGAIVRTSYVGGSNRQPAAVARVIPDNGAAPLSVTFDASGSEDVDGDALTFNWNLGDGEQSAAPTLQKTYPPGVYTVDLTVTDSGGLSNSIRASRVVSGNTRPSAIVREPAPGALYDEGEVITFHGVGIDTEEGLIPCARLTWTVFRRHLRHTHPFFGPVYGACDGSFTIRSEGESQSSFEILLSVDDTGAPLGTVGVLTAEAAVRIYPRLGLGSGR
ncbi:MAG: PKD domain-containing protein [Acidobacteria bacterium]|nr:PKD domain-containing protein [Acidobacteriota bacterium]